MCPTTISMLLTLWTPFRQDKTWIWINSTTWAIWISKWTCSSSSNNRRRTPTSTWPIHRCFSSTTPIWCRQQSKMPSRWVNITSQWTSKIQWTNSSSSTGWWTCSKTKGIMVSRWTTTTCNTTKAATKCNSMLAQEATTTTSRTRTLVNTTTSRTISNCLRPQEEGPLMGSSLTHRQVLRCQWDRWWTGTTNLTEGEIRSSYVHTPGMDQGLWVLAHL